jgi:hypothetical protein
MVENEMKNNLADELRSVAAMPQIRVLKWTIYKVVTPLLVIFIIWPIYWGSLGIEHPFEKAFTHGDLLIFAALILIETVIEGEGSEVRDFRFHLGRHTALVLAVVSLILFTVVKVDIMRSEALPVYHKMRFYGGLGWAIAILAGVLSFYAYSRESYNKVSAKVSSLEQPGP